MGGKGGMKEGRERGGGSRRGGVEGEVEEGEWRGSRRGGVEPHYSLKLLGCREQVQLLQVHSFNQAK